MESQSPPIHPEDEPRKRFSTSLRSGAGAPIFEPGPQTRIRRNPTRAIASATWQGGPRGTFGQILDVSLTGCLFRTESTIDTGTILQLSITVIRGGADLECELRGVVRRTTTVRGRQAYGVHFLTESKSEKEAVQALYSESAR